MAAKPASRRAGTQSSPRKAIVLHAFFLWVPDLVSLGPRGPRCTRPGHEYSPTALPVANCQPLCAGPYSGRRSRIHKRRRRMDIQTLGYVGIRAKSLEDWTSFGTRFLGMQPVEKSNKKLAFRMDDRKQ